VIKRVDIYKANWYIINDYRAYLNYGNTCSFKKKREVIEMKILCLITLVLCLFLGGQSCSKSQEEPMPMKEEGKEIVAPAKEEGKEVAAPAAEEGKEVVEETVEENMEEAEKAVKEATEETEKAVGEGKEAVKEAEE
jgi:hypothetical protein